MPSKRLSIIAAQPEFHYFLDRMLGSRLMAAQLRRVGLKITIHDDRYIQTERDPWIYYRCGRESLVVVTADLKFMKSHPHMRAVALGRTTVIAFTNNNYNSNVRGDAFLAAKARLERALKKRNASGPFIGVIGMDGSFRIKDPSPHPLRQMFDLRDWESYKRACKDAGVTVPMDDDPAMAACKNPA